MAYKYQRGLQVSSGSLHVEHDLTGSGNNILGSANTAKHRAYGVLDLSDADGASYGLQLGGTLVTSTAAELNLLDGAAVGKKVASKAAIYSSSGSLNTWGLAVVDGAYNLTIASHDGSNGLVLGSTLVTATAAQLNYNSGVTAGTAAASKAVVLDAKKDITGILNITASFFKGDGSALTNISMESMDLTRGYVWIGDSDGEADAVDAKGSGKILIGDGTDLNSVSVSGDVTISTAGAVTIADNAVEGAMILSGAVGTAKIADQAVINRNLGTGSVTVNAIKQGAVTMAALATGSVENNAYASGSVQNGHLAGSIANAKLSNSAVTLTQGAGMAALGSVSLGGSVTVAVDGVLEDLDSLGAASSDGEMIVATGAGAFAYESGATLRTSIGVGTGDSPQFTGLNITGFCKMSGNVDLGDGGADTVKIKAGQLNIENGLLFGNIKYKNEDYTISAGDYMINAGAGHTLTLPAVASLEDGTVFVIKNGDGDASASSQVTIDGNGSETLDGATVIYLESPYAAVTLMCSGSGWLVL